MIVYHGSKSLFDKFDYTKMGLNGTTEGFGFYFTDNKEVAERFAVEGYLYIVEFLGKQPLSSTNITISAAKLKKLITGLDRTDSYLSNFGDIDYEGHAKVLNKAIECELEYSDSDVDLICSIANSYGNRSEVLITLHKLLGYDSIQMKADWDDQNLYIAIVNDIIEIKEIIKTPTL